MTAPPDRIMPASAFAFGSAAPPTLSAQGMNHCVAPQPPKMGMVPSAMPTNVSRSSGGRKTVAIDTDPVTDAPAFRTASQRCDSGTQNHTTKASIIGDAHTSSVHRHESGPTSYTYPRPLSATSPTFADVPSIPATSGRDASDHASEANATPVGHMPPTPIAARNRDTKSCSGVAEK